MLFENYFDSSVAILPTTEVVGLLATVPSNVSIFKYFYHIFGRKALNL